MGGDAEPPLGGVRDLAHGGRPLPRLGLGTFGLRGAQAEEAVSAALVCGYRHVDTASAYRNEAAVGAAVAASGVPREEVFVTTKVSPRQAGFDAAARAVEESLKALGGAADLVLVHWPGASGVAHADARRNRELREGTWRALERARAQGQCGAIGVSNFGVRHLEELWALAATPPCVNQVEIHPEFQQREVRDWCAERGVATVAYSSLGRGELLADPVVQAVTTSASSRAPPVATPAQVLLRWGLQSGLAVIPKSACPDRVRENAGCCAPGFSLSEEEMASLDALGTRARKRCWDPSGVS